MYDGVFRVGQMSGGKHPTLFDCVRAAEPAGCQALCRALARGPVSSSKAAGDDEFSEARVMSPGSHPLIYSRPRRTANCRRRLRRRSADGFFTRRPHNFLTPPAYMQ